MKQVPSERLAPDAVEDRAQQNAAENTAPSDNRKHRDSGCWCKPLVNTMGNNVRHYSKQAKEIRELGKT